MKRLPISRQSLFHVPNMAHRQTYRVAGALLSMTDVEKTAAAKMFAERWRDRGYEKGETDHFWLELLGDVLGLDNPTQHLDVEVPVEIDGKTKFVDAYLPETSVLIEQKSANVDLTKGYKQSDGSILTPFQQARRYGAYLPYNRRPRWIVVSNFQEIRVYDMNRPNDPPEIILLQRLPYELYRLGFLTAERDERIRRETEISIEAGDIVAGIYRELRNQYNDSDSPASLESLNILCVRLVFCLYAEDAGIFGKGQFGDYLKGVDADHTRGALQDLFKVLDTREEDRDPYMLPVLAAFPHVNGGLFARSDVEIPMFTDFIRSLLIDSASDSFDWSKISPTIFGAIFEATLDPDKRRAGGMHYTSIENIHKVIDPLFLDALNDEFADILDMKQKNKRADALRAFQKKIGSLTFLDPACGSGNFLTETYLSLRRLENKILEALYRGQMALEAIDPIQVSIASFHGIEINDFAVSVAQTALWIAESQTMRETEEIVHMQLDFLPLKTAAHVVEGNALRMDWNNVVPASKLDYIMGNPPFSGARIMSKEQKADIMKIFEGWKNAGNLDYVSCWFKVASDYMHSTDIRAALVATNSVSQGESVGVLWEKLLRDGAHIDFAWQTFRWDSEASLKAHVHVVVIGFSRAPTSKNKFLYADTHTHLARNINGYLTDGPNIAVHSRQHPICDVPEIGIGNKPIDGGFYLFTDEEKFAFIKTEPASEKWFKPWYGSVEFIHSKPRWCLWLGDCPPNTLSRMPKCRERVQAVQNYRRASKSAPTRKLGDRPTRFHVENMPRGNYIVIPEVSSERRRYVPIGYMNDGVLCSNLVKIVASDSLYHFGVLTSNVHNAWMRTVAGRLKSDYRYSKDIVYNNFPWPDPTPAQKARIEKTAQAILDARALYPDSSLADLYDEVTMPPELRKAHQDNDRAVMAAYNLPISGTSEADAVAHLMRLYQKLTEKE